MPFPEVGAAWVDLNLLPDSVSPKVQDDLPRCVPTCRSLDLCEGLLGGEWKDRQGAVT